MSLVKNYTNGVDAAKEKTRAKVAAEGKRRQEEIKKFILSKKQGGQDPEESDSDSEKDEPIEPWEEWEDAQFLDGLRF